MENKSSDSYYISVEQFAQRCGLSTSSAYKIARSENFYPSTRIAGRLLVSTKALERWIEERAKQKGGNSYE